MKNLTSLKFLILPFISIFLCGCDLSFLDNFAHSDSQSQSHIVEFDTRGGTEVQSQTIVHGEKVSKPTDPKKDGYQFLNWVNSDDEQWLFDSYKVFEDITLYASWRDVREFSVSFVNNDGSLLYKTTVYSGEYVSYPYENPEAKNKDPQYFYTFIGWDKNLLITSDTVLTAQYDMKKAAKVVYYYDYDDTLLAMYQLKEGESGAYKGETPKRPSNSSMQLQYSFRQWVLEEKIGELEKYRADYISCTLGLDFRDNVVSRYHGESTNVFVPSFWEGNNISIIGLSCFEGTHVQSVTLSEGIVSLNSRSFYSCASLTEIVLPTGLESIGPLSFYSCVSLKAIDIPSGVTSIGETAFLKCFSLLSISLPDTLKIIGNQAFYYCSNLTAVIIPDSVTGIGNQAFYYCSNLTSAVISDSVTTIDNDAFAYCKSLKSVVLGRGVLNVGDYAFSNCSALKTAFIPKNVVNMGTQVFSCDYSITIYCEAKSKPSGWHNDWAEFSGTVVWGYTPS